ncbi:MAG: MaoC family dehydratase [Pseudomonadota bacterium]
MTARDAAVAALSARRGETFGPSRWIEVDQEMISSFGAVTHDEQFIHMDPSRAAKTPLGGTIAHGFLTLSLASRMAYDCFDPLPGQSMGINYGMDRLRFLNPVRPGQRVRGRFVLSEVSARGDDALMRTTALTIEIEGLEKPALVADWLGMVMF